jgi:hypothetical protein
MYYSWERWEINMKFHSENMKGIDHFEDLGVDGKLILK